MPVELVSFRTKSSWCRGWHTLKARLMQLLMVVRLMGGPENACGVWSGRLRQSFQLPHQQGSPWRQTKAQQMGQAPTRTSSDPRP